MTLLARGKRVTLWKHAADAMACERPRVREEDLLRVLEEPDHDDGTKAWKWVGGRTILLYYEEEEDALRVRSVSATRRKLP